MQSLTPVHVFAVCFALAVNSTFADDQSAIRQAVVYDSAMSHTDFKRMADSRNGIKPFNDNSLTWAIMSLSGDDDVRTNPDFRVLHAEDSKPAELAAAWQNEIYRERVTGDRRILTHPITIIHADRITSITCEVKGAIATGVVAFKVPELYQGSVRYSANKGESGWVISEFEMPNRRIHLVRNPNGFWISKPK